MATLEIKPLHPTILKGYGAIVRAEYQLPNEEDVVEIEFATVRHAASWAETCCLTREVVFTDPVTVLHAPVRLRWVVRPIFEII